MFLAGLGFYGLGRDFLPQSSQRRAPTCKCSGACSSAAGRRGSLQHLAQTDHERLHHRTIAVVLGRWIRGVARTNGAHHHRAAQDPGAPANGEFPVTALAKYWVVPSGRPAGVGRVDGFLPSIASDSRSLFQAKSIGRVLGQGAIAGRDQRKDASVLEIVSVTILTSINAHGR